MAEKSIQTPGRSSTGKSFWNVPRIGADLLQVMPGVPTDAIVDLADNLMHCVEVMLAEEVREPDADRAFVMEFLVKAARACYQSIGAKP